MRTSGNWAVALGIVALCGSTEAALVDRGGGLIYDTELNVTWLQNWNQGGQTNWDDARDWAENLVWGGFSDWRLPTMLDTGALGCDRSNAGGTDCGYNVQTKSGSTVYSEFAHLWYETLGNIPFCGLGPCTGSQPGYGLTNAGPFVNMRPGVYWFGTEYAPDTSKAWYFNFSYGSQVQTDKAGLVGYAVAVRSGDVTASVPEPRTLSLALLALGATMVLRWQRPRWQFAAVRRH